jgi:2-amino-4-hydroxy-6-hydroxymethyldihydropteridine diphosphokinase
VFLSLGSNLQPRKNLTLAISELHKRFGAVQLSSVYRSEPHGFSGDDFLNLVACVETRKSPSWIVGELEAIHDLAGRQRGSDRFAPRELDIDLLLYDDLVTNQAGLRIPRSDVLAYSFVLGPLAEIAGNLVHPVTGKSLREHWQEFDQKSHPLTIEVDFFERP